MNTQTHSKSPILPVGKWNNDRRVQTGSTAFVQAKKSKILFTLTVLTWIVDAFMAIAFTFAVRNAPAEADWLACLLLGMLFLGWILVSRYVGDPPIGQGD